MDLSEEKVKEVYNLYNRILLELLSNYLIF